MKGNIWYYEIFFYILELVVSNAQILMSKFTDAPSMLQFRLNLVEQLANARTFRRTERCAQSLEPIPHFHLIRDHFHYPIAIESRLKCKVHIQRVDTQYACAVSGVSICPDFCFHYYHTMIDYLLVKGMANQWLKGDRQPAPELK